MPNSKPQAKHPYLTPVQLVVLASYDDGSFDHLKDEPTVEDFNNALKECGDGIFKGVFRELSPSEDCNEVQIAVNRILKIAQQINDVERAVVAME